ncbi:uncharacterized protein LOC129756850 isoform X2 [Uranotaenia lowii]|uniref:uncharacterized protein LOC129756850 isoform X2 n=1 Tax=Uranotaenia lowii TaxID=190385 RepID=UPI002479512F|nr:uncharacterized protein LOC129756850 isoform X2 [Uranotaenia lowii]
MFMRCGTVYCSFLLTLVLYYLAKTRGEDSHERISSNSTGNNVVEFQIKYGEGFQYQNYRGNSQYWVDSSCSIGPGCLITCKNMLVDSINDRILAFFRHPPCKEIDLLVENLLLEDGILFPGWLDLRDVVGVTTLTIRQSKISEIEPGSFEVVALRNTTQLTLDSLEIWRLKQDVFTGFECLEELSLKNLSLTFVDPQVLDPVKSTLRTLLVESSLQGISPRAFTGSVMLDQLQNAFLRFNNYSNGIEDDAFCMAPMLKNLYLSDSGLTQLSKGLIDNIGSVVEQIHLQRNLLKTIEFGTFERLIDRDVKIYLNGNLFDCSCSLVYLQNTIRDNEGLFDEILCHEPDNFADQLVSESEFCFPMPTDSTPGTSAGTTTEFDDTTTTVETDTTETSTIADTTETSTLDNASKLLTLQCAKELFLINSNVISVIGSTQDITRRSKIFAITEIDEGVVEIIFDKRYCDSTIVWFYDTASDRTPFSWNIEEAALCLDIYENAIRIPNLHPGLNYVFCVLHPHESSISPFDCLPHQMLPIRGHRTWLVANDKVKVISLLISSILVAVMVGVLFTYFCLKRFITHQKSSKQVITEVTIENTAPTQYYMTPVAHERKFSMHKRSASETSLESCRSYVSATQFRYIAWKLGAANHKSTTFSNSGGIDSFPREPPPPPLPPHPYSSKRNSEQQSTTINVNFQEHQIYSEPFYVESLPPFCQRCSGVSASCSHGVAP